MNTPASRHIWEPAKPIKPMRIAHELLWRDWVRGSLEQRHADAILYLRDLSTDFERLLSLWLESAPFAAFVLRCASEAERTLFINDLRLVLELLHNQCDKPAYTVPGQSHAPDPRWEQIVFFIFRNYSGPELSLRKVSTALHIPMRSARRLFKAETGKTFREYLLDIRIREAARLLTTSSEAVKAISAMVGYTDPSHFTRYFHEVIGCTPGEYRQKGRKLARSGATSASN